MTYELFLYDIIWHQNIFSDTLTFISQFWQTLVSNHGGFHSGATPKIDRWYIVYNETSQTNMDDEQGYPPISGNLHMDNDESTATGEAVRHLREVLRLLLGAAQWGARSEGGGGWKMGLVELGWVTHDFLSGTFQKQHQTTFLPRWIYQGVPFLKTHYDTLMLCFFCLQFSR